MSRTISIRRSLQRSLIGIVLIFGVAILAMSCFGSQHAIQRFSQSLIDQSLSGTEARLSAFFDPVSRELEALREWGAAGRLDLDDPQALNEILGAFMRQHPWVTAGLVANDAGREHLLQRVGVRWRSRQTLDPDESQRVIWWEWLGDSSVATQRQEILEYDPRTRPWFVGAVLNLGAGEPHWTAAYTFLTTGDPGITASVAFEADGRAWVIGLDVTLLDISRFTSELLVSERGAVYVLDEGGRIVGMPRGPDFPDDESLRGALLKRPDELGTVVARDLSAALLGEQIATSPQRFRSEGGAWWGQLRRFDLSSLRPLYIGVAVPGADLLGDVMRQRIWVGVLTVLALGMAVARAGMLAGRYSKPIKALVIESERMSTGDLEPCAPIVTDVEEVQRLAQAHEKMRQGLATLLKIEQDLRVARRIQMNTFPARLPDLPGFDLAAWSEPADETGGDSYDVIGLPGASTADDAGRAVLLLADATGHGIGPALSVTQVRAMLRLAVRMSLDLSQIVTHINHQLCADLPTGRFVTAWLAVIDAQTGQLQAVSAGQSPILHYRAAADELDVLKADTMPLGVLDQGPIAIPDPIDLAPGDIYAAISDGIFEAVNRSQEMFGDQRVQQIIREQRDTSAAEILEQIRTRTEAFTEGLPPDDDRTIIVVKRL